MLVLRVIIVHLGLVPFGAGAHGAEVAALVPQRLLQLVHAPEVQGELDLAAERLDSLERLLVEVDAVWLPSRNLSPAKQREVMIGLEKRVWDWATANLSNRHVQRLHQIERQAQGVRMMLRDDLAKELALTPAQIQAFADRAAATEKAREAYNEASAQGRATEALKTHATKTATAEQKALEKALTPKQHSALRKSLGKPFETASLKRIYPLAPEIVPVDTWINSKPLTLASLRAKVVVVHFYAFECHNCHANFAIYKRWHDTLTKKGVVVLGIQTPETPSERDPKLVAAAAQDRQLDFPILVDLDGKNWSAWGNTMWPCVYVVDKNGYLRAWWMGELNRQGATGDKLIEDAIDGALAEAGSSRKP